MGCDKRTDNGKKIINDFPLGKKGRRGERNGGEELGREFESWDESGCKRCDTW